MRLMAIDPGPVDSGFVIVSGEAIIDPAKLPTPEVLARLRRLEVWDVDVVVIEKIASYGMAVGREVFATCQATGRMIEAAVSRGIPVRLIERMHVKLALCHSPKANDSTLRMALIDRYGGKDAAIGRKASPGPLYRVKSDAWAALALGLAFQDGARCEEICA